MGQSYIKVSLISAHAYQWVAAGSRRGIRKGPYTFQISRWFVRKRIKFLTVLELASGHVVSNMHVSSMKFHTEFP